MTLSAILSLFNIMFVVVVSCLHCRYFLRSMAGKGKAGILERLQAGVVIGDGGFLFELEKRGYITAGPFTPEVGW